MHSFSSSSHFVFMSKNCIAITSDGLIIFSFKRILKQSCAVFAFSSSVTSSILQDAACTIQTLQYFHSHFVIWFQIKIIKKKPTMNEEFKCIIFFFRKFLCQFTEPNAKRNARSTFSIKRSYKWHIVLML